MRERVIMKMGKREDREMQKREMRKKVAVEMLTENEK